MEGMCGARPLAGGAAPTAGARPLGLPGARPAPGLCERRGSHERATVSGRGCGELACRALLSTATLDPAKLTVDFLSPVTASGPQLPACRRYTLTHSDVTGELHLSVGREFNEAQLSGWYLRFIRDEVLAEWLVDEQQTLQLHLFCHISSSRWSAPVLPALRSRIFRREMPLVLRAIKYAEQELLEEYPDLLTAPVFVHFSSHIKALDVQLAWGSLGDEDTWHKPAAAWYVAWWRRLLGLAALAQWARARRLPLPEPPGPEADAPPVPPAAAGERESLAERRQALESLVAGAVEPTPGRDEANAVRQPPDRSLVAAEVEALRLVAAPVRGDAVAGLASKELNNIIARNVHCRQ